MAQTIYDHEAHWEQAAEVFRQLQEYVVGEAAQKELHEVEAGLYQRLLALGQLLLRQYVAASGTGYDPDQPLATLDGRPLTFKGLQSVEYLSIFGSIQLTRAAYEHPDGGYVYPMDAQWNRPAQKYSYLLQKWLQAVASEDDYREAAQRLHELLGVSLDANVPQRLTQAVAVQVDAYYEHAEPPAPETEGSHLLATADGKGVRIVGQREPQDEQKARPRRGKGQKRGTKKEAVVTADATFDPVPRDPQELVDMIMRGRTAAERERRRQERVQRREQGLPEPRAPQHTHARATLLGKDKAFQDLARRLRRRDPQGRKQVVVLLDGDPALEQRLRAAMRTEGREDRIDAVIADLWHVMEYVWEVGTALHGETGPQRTVWVEDKLRSLLKSQVGRVVGGLRQMRTKGRVTASQERALGKAITYFENHRHMMDYAEYLARGYPVATGLIEGLCNSLVNDRMEQSGMRWSLSGAEAMLQQRAVKKNGDWNDFWLYRIDCQRHRLYPATYQKAA
jgi:hypothetical protein